MCCKRVFECVMIIDFEHARLVDDTNYNFDILKFTRV